MNTTWDDELCYILTPALSAYELEHCTGISAGNEEFQQAIRRAIPDGHTFKGFPIQFVHRNTRRAFATCLRCVIFGAMRLVLLVPIRKKKLLAISFSAHFASLLPAMSLCSIVLVYTITRNNQRLVEPTS